jgi:hypothetical protein
MRKTQFWILVACAVGQWMPVADPEAGMLVMSNTKFLICLKKTFVLPKASPLDP